MEDGGEWMRQQGRRKEASKRKGFCGLDQVCGANFPYLGRGEAHNTREVKIGGLAPLLPRVSALYQASNWRRATAAQCDMGHRWAATTAWTAWGRGRLHVFARAPPPSNTATAEARFWLGKAPLSLAAHTIAPGGTRERWELHLSPPRFAATSRLIQKRKLSLRFHPAF